MQKNPFSLHPFLRTGPCCIAETFLLFGGGLASENPESGPEGLWGILFRNKTISEVEVVIPLPCKPYHRGDVKKSGQCSQTLRTLVQIQLATQPPLLTANTLGSSSQTCCQHVGNGDAIICCVWHHSGVSWETELPGPSEAATEEFTVPFGARWLQHAIKARVSNKHATMESPKAHGH